MYHEQNPLIGEDDDWAERSVHWMSETSAILPKRRLRQRNPAPLILCGHGVSMRIEHGALVIREGFTHYPQEQAKYRFFPRDLELPTRILLLDGSGTLSFDVLSWLAEQNVAFARVRWNGEVATVASGTGYAADADKVGWQRNTRSDGASRLAFAASTIRQKLIASIKMLRSYVAESSVRDTAIFKAQAGVNRLGNEKFRDINAIFAIEGECAGNYFRAWQGLPMHWTGAKRHPVPEGWHCYPGRTSLANGEKPENRNASHPINSMLNYAYGVKLAQLQIQAVAEGYDPTLGIIHNGRRGKPALILDLIEPQRPLIDGLILQLVCERRFAAADFILRTDGVCRLSPQLARMIATTITAKLPDKALVLPN